MKNFLKKLLVFAAILISTFTLINIANKTPAYADNRINGDPCPNFLGLTSWDCDVETPTSEKELAANIWKIATNILLDISVVAAYLVIGYVIYGGYLYMFSSGDPNKVSSGKKTLTHAFIGLAIVTLSTIILGAIRIALIGDTSLADCASDNSACINSAPETLVTNLVGWVIGIAGVVSAIFLVIGGVGYITSSGDANKLQKSKNTITYALIGLAIVGLSEIIVSVVSGIISNGTTPTP
ncbi:hypothetical protein IJJ36_03105 [Candidatus Saccharibacteria bacterium]|nr:hypothetical protein [Candidatus Saccharibacteria bacterium]